MKKTSIVLFCTFITSISLYEVFMPSYYLRLLINPAKPYLLMRFIITICLTAYTFLPQIRTYTLRYLLALSGGLALVLGALPLFWPNIFGALSYYMELGDLFIVLEDGILAMLICLVLPVHKPAKFSEKGIQYIKSFISKQPILPVISSTVKVKKPKLQTHNSYTNRSLPVTR